MQESDGRFVGSIPANDDRHLGPLIFEPYACDLAARLAAPAPLRVLETAAGTGVATRALAGASPVSTEIVATDLGRPMLDVAAARTDAANVTWWQADALALPFDDGAFDVVACRFGAMFFPGKVTAYREARRELRPGGHFLLSVWDRIERNEVAKVVTEAVAALFPEDPPRFLARAPHGDHDTGAIEGELRAAGFARVAVETVAKTCRASSPRQPSIGFCQGSPLRFEIEAKGPGRLDETTEAAARAIAARFGDGPFDARMQAHDIVAGS